MATPPSTKALIEKLLLEQLGDAGEPFRRLNMSMVAREVGVDPKTVQLVVTGLVEHKKIEASPLRRHWYRKTETESARPMIVGIDLLERMASHQRQLEERLSILESRMGMASKSQSVSI